MSLSAPFIARPVGTTLLTIAVALAGAIALSRPAGLAAAAGRLPDHSGQRVAARRQPRDDGLVGRDAARAAVRAHRRHHRDDLGEPARLDRDHAAVRSEPQHRRRRARRAGRDQRRARPAAAEPAEQSDLSQGQSGRRADSAPGADVRRHSCAADVRRGLVDPAAEAVAGPRRRPGERRRRRAAGGARRRESDRAEQLRPRPRRRADTAGHRQRQRAERNPGRSDADLVAQHDRSAVQGRPVPAARAQLSQRRRAAPVRRGDGLRLGRGRPRTPATPTASRRCC